MPESESAAAKGAGWPLIIAVTGRVGGLIISVVGSFLAFNQFYIMTQGGPGTSTVSVVMAIYDTAFTQFNIGLASAMSVVLVIIVGLITFAQFYFLQRKAE